MDMQIERDLTRIYAFFTFGSFDNKKRLFQVLFWIVFSIPFLAITSFIMLLDTLDVIISAICNILSLTYILIPVGILIHYVICIWVIPLIQIPFYLISGMLLLLRAKFNDDLKSDNIVYYEEISK